MFYIADCLLYIIGYLSSFAFVPDLFKLLLPFFQFSLRLFGLFAACSVVKLLKAFLIGTRKLLRIFIDAPDSYAKMQPRIALILLLYSQIDKILQPLPDIRLLFRMFPHQHYQADSVLCYMDDSVAKSL